MRARLLEYAGAGRLDPAEVTVLASLRERRRARRWAGEVGGRRAERAMAAYQVAATRLAYQRHRALLHRADADAAWQEARLAAGLDEARHTLVESLRSRMGGAAART